MIEDEGPAVQVNPQQLESVWPPAPTLEVPEGVSDPTLEFRPMNLLLLLVFIVGTLTIYEFFWMHRQIRVMNARLKSPPVSFAAFWITTGLYTAHLVAAFAISDTSPFSDIDMLLRIIAGIAMLILAFGIRYGINASFSVRPNSPEYANKIGTVFLSSLYLQYKINQNLKRIRN